MRRIVVAGLLIVGTMVALASTAAAAIQDPYGGGTLPTTTIRVGGEVVVRQGVDPALAFTGSSHTPSMVLIGLACVTIGLVLFVATRRRRVVLDRG